MLEIPTQRQDSVILGLVPRLVGFGLGLRLVSYIHAQGKSTKEQGVCVRQKTHFMTLASSMKSSSFMAFSFIILMATSNLDLHLPATTRCVCVYVCVCACACACVRACVCS